MKYPNAREIIAHGGRVALATDFNPGTSPTQSLNFVGVLARLEMKMSLAEVYSAFTIGGAYALGLEKSIGVVAPGYSADLAVFDADWDQLFYQVGFHPINMVFYRGRKVTA